ncbi:MAG: hypothetical protein R3233_09055 [Xanthomonadales bacterium]|nr:hypothetical protein [Xanthomonadales bacterium]
MSVVRMLSALMIALALAACHESAPSEWSAEFDNPGFVADPGLSEASGLVASRSAPGHLFAINDSLNEPELFVLDRRGLALGRIEVSGAANRDWEDLAHAEGPDGSLLVIGDFGDNDAVHPHVTLYFVDEPEPDADGAYPDAVPLRHTLRLRYPDGPRDVEALAWDSRTGELLVISKRDRPPRIYTVPLDQALSASELQFTARGTLPPLPAPSMNERASSARLGQWVGQPTGLDIADDLSWAALITYRGLYLYRREDSESWLDALQRAPLEFRAPGVMTLESVALLPGSMDVIALPEGQPAPLLRYRIRPPEGPR